MGYGLKIRVGVFSVHVLHDLVKVSTCTSFTVEKMLKMVK